jgi:hypothetical protein
VVREDHRAYFEQSVQAVTALSGASNWTWLVVDNSGNGLEGFFPESDRRFVPVQGVDPSRLSINHPSYHHAAGLHAALPLIRTRFVLILDPDFYVVRRHWLVEIPAHMRHRGLAFFGATWHPRWPTKYRYFPAVHCLFIDSSVVPLTTLDFTPCLAPPSTAAARKARLSGLRWLGPARWLWALLAAPSRERRRRHIGVSRDTGWRVFERFCGRRDLAWETSQPVVRFDRDFATLPHLRFSIGRHFERLFPENISYLPARPHYYATSGFVEQGWPDASGAGWEEHLWRGAPFGVHVRKTMLDRQSPQRDRGAELSLLQRILAEACARNGD